MRCFRNLLGISYKEHIANEAVRDRIRQAMGSYDDTSTTVKTLFPRQRPLCVMGRLGRKKKRAFVLRCRAFYFFYYYYFYRDTQREPLRRREAKTRKFKKTKEALGEKHLWLDRVKVLPRPYGLETTSNGGQRLLGS